MEQIQSVEPLIAHSRLGASSMYRWSQCPGSVRLCEGIPKTTSAYAEEGTKAHELAAEIIKAIYLGGDSPDTCFDTIDDGSLDDTLDAVNSYVDVIQSDIQDQRQDREPYAYVVHVEIRFDLSSVYPDCFGTADCVVYFPELKKLIVYDYKHGQGIAVEVQAHGKVNPQLQYYGLGALVSLGYPCEEIELVIVQPRCPHPDGPVRRATVTPLEILDFCADLIDYAEATKRPDAVLRSGDHCRFCPAAGVCPELRAKAQLVAKEQFSPALSYDPAKLAEALSMVPIAEAWVKNVREFAYAEAMHGRLPPGWKLVPKRATRRWVGGTTSTAIAELTGLIEEKCFELKLKSPAQIEKLLSKPERAELESLIVKESSGSSLVPDSDKRDALRKDPQSEFTIIDDITALT